ncbi:MAG: hypothetical protein A3C15_02155 [Candidatus Magasanikbacteria bacterium RIFCSPHIGHO2_02_FULL_50_9b]|uniref:BioF2-like acetyltransferase domain-containing protein n=1 Tax=Candidatus Magasanikbacteria bacterium RIFCSPHIGHO2_02_FULL_50_9b TaxID=1798682 RepID=A0A1F6M882_9BACT|nr:MAG: hypothetical protein A3C15_02155 [Candidatus Magasanikbacteria bacterium RIFCSPHIGHO2_02_FULL_50_9b]
MDVTRLTRVRDVCPFAPTAHHWIFATRWMARVTAGVAPIEYFETGYTVTVLKNRLICWRRTFTTGSGAPSVATSDSLFTIHEWCPSVWPQPRDRRGWRRFGMQHCEAIVFLSEIDRENFARSWSAQARRHLVVFKKNSTIALRLGTLADLENNIGESQVPARLHPVFLNCVRQHLVVQPETIEILVAVRAATNEVLGCFVAGNCAEARQSYYLTGFFRRGTEKMQVMTGLVAWWFERTIARNFLTLNFGHSTNGSLLSRTESGVGYSIFKTHFGVRRVWWPGSFWRIL